MYNPIRRNRNIGTKKAGFKSQSVFKDAPCQGHHFLKSEKRKEIIHGTPVTFYIDTPRIGYVHSCSVEDVVGILNQLPKEDVEGIEHIQFKQSSRKQNNFSPAWGRLYYHVPPKWHPLLVVEAQPCPLVIKTDLSLDSFWQAEVEFLKECCEVYKLEKRHHRFVFGIPHIRKVQLFRTVPHEIGHWVDYKLGLDERPDKELRAHQYAKRFCLKDPNAILHTRTQVSS
jgi:hypothetical protein